MSDYPLITWEENGEQRTSRWRSERQLPPPKRVVMADDTLQADKAFRLASEGAALLWRGDFQNARQLLLAMARRIERGGRKPRKEQTPVTPADAFHLHRQAQSQRARTLSMLLIPLNADYTVPLRRAPDVRDACTEAYGPVAANSAEDSVVALREILGLIGAHEWRKKGVRVAELEASIHPHYGVFSPVRGEYLKLVNQASLPSTELAFDIGVGTGVLSALLARRGVKRVVATDNDPRALACAADNVGRLGLNDTIELQQRELFPDGLSPLVVCNPPWVPARASCTIERTVYDQDSGMLKGFLNGLAAHLTPDGEGWLIISDLAEHLGLRTREELLGWIEGAGLRIIDRLDTRPTHGKTADASDPLHVARRAEVTSLWRLGIRAG